MFGRKRNKLEEKIKEVFAQIHEQKDEFESRFSSMEESGKSVHTDVDHVTKNTNEIAGYAMQNIEEEAELLHEIDDFSNALKTAVDEYMQLKEKVIQHNEAVTNLVEDNKHYTTPSKYLTEAPAAMRQTYQSHQRRLEELAETERQIGVMALNVAIEAGRMGETGKQFVETSETIRQTAAECEKAALGMKEELADAQAKVHELEEVILRLVSLIKDGNKATTRLLKKSMELDKMVKDSTMRDFTEDVTLLRDKVVAIRNLDEETLKSSERNKIQLKDIQEELHAQQGNLGELERDFSYILEQTKDNVR